MNSGLLLANSKVDAAEIATSSTGYDEVVLSAWSSGWGPMSAKGVELAGSLLGSWRPVGAGKHPCGVRQAADRFMTIYHQNRLNGQTPMLALQQTQFAMAAENEVKPFTWIGFTVYGCQ